MRRVIIVLCVVMVLSFGGSFWFQQAAGQEASSEGATEQALPEGEEELDLEREVDTLFAQKCLACHERARVDLEAPSMSLAEWMHVVKWMQKKAPDFITDEEATKIRREYIERIRQQIDQIEESLEVLQGLLSP